MTGGGPMLLRRCREFKPRDGEPTEGFMGDFGHTQNLVGKAQCDDAP